MIIVISIAILLGYLLITSPMGDKMCDGVVRGMVRVLRWTLRLPFFILGYLLGRLSVSISRRVRGKGANIEGQVCLDAAVLVGMATPPIAPMPADVQAAAAAVSGYVVPAAHAPVSADLVVPAVVCANTIDAITLNWARPVCAPAPVAIPIAYEAPGIKQGAQVHTAAHPYVEWARTWKPTGIFANVK